MKKKLKPILALILTGGIAAAAGAAATWWGLGAKAESHKRENKSAEKPEVDTTVQKYVSLEKVIVMLRRKNGETVPHYLAADLVFKTTEDKEKLIKSHLPMLRSEAVQALSAYSMEKAEAMTVGEFAVEIDRVLVARYVRDRQVKPFSEVMIGKLIIE
jgi:flagellar protein FliL